MPLNLFIAETAKFFIGQALQQLPADIHALLQLTRRILVNQFLFESSAK
jgi:hypothetical protein